ncbi:hypothetical protein TNCV_1912691 [Trichonephila clavipes]|nr:hypothetical protein TNCV_1912691 [Trichonephila clavipes]
MHMSSHGSCQSQLLEHVWIFIGRRFGSSSHRPVTIQTGAGTLLALQVEWAAMLQQLITPSFSAWADAVKPA